DGLEVTRALTLAPHFADVVMGYEKAVGRTTLDKRLHEIVRYRVAQLNQCTVCLAFRWDSGVDEDVHAQVADWRASSEFSAVERAALAFTEQFCRDSAAISDELIAELEQLLPPGQVVELTLVVGKYVAMGRFMQVLGLDQNCDLSSTR
ncbi:MAG TPA: carboxymuconolactone decarboxylase family protein, partial [Mycobacterium sp.]|nr:carboxymuconolactone decarboxylase family protein [Mycobacterium sp.]